MNISFFIAKRFLESGKKIKFFNSVSYITISGIAIGVTVVIIALTVLDGFENVVAEKIADFNSHIKVIGFGNRNLSDPEEVVRLIKTKFPHDIISIEPFASKLAIIKSKRTSDGITLTGIDSSFAQTSFQKFQIDGNISMTNQSEIIIGKYLAQKHFLKVGDKISIFCLNGNQLPTVDNPPSVEQFRVSGIFETGISEYDDGNAFIQLAKAQQVFGMNNEVSGFNINVSDLKKVNILSDKLQDFLGYPFFVRTIYQIHQNIFTWIDLQKKPIPIVLGLIIIVAVFNIVGTMLMIVLERINNIGILRSLGMNRTTILKSFLLYSANLIGKGLFWGVVISLLLSILQKEFNVISLPEKIYFVTSVPIFIDWRNYLIVILITLLVSFISALIPAYIASKIKPLSAIRFD